MFTWICPQCGREVPPAYDECPDCAAKTAQSAGGVAPGAAVGAQSAVPPASAMAAMPPAPALPQALSAPYDVASSYGSLGLGQKTPPQAPPSPYAAPAVYASTTPPYAPPQPAPQGYAPAPQFQPGAPPPAGYPQAAYYPPQPPPAYSAAPAYSAPAVIGPGRPSLPSWLLTVIFAVGFVVVVGGIYWIFGSSHSSSPAVNTTPASVNAPPAAAAKASSLQRYFEVSGVRFLQDSKQNTQAKFVIINHSDAEVSGLTGTVTILGKSSKSEEPEGTISFSTNIGPNESKELTEPFNTKLRVYELPDWQNVVPDLRITGPQ